MLKTENKKQNHLETFFHRLSLVNKFGTGTQLTMDDMRDKVNIITLLMLLIFWPMLTWSQIDPCASATNCGVCTLIPDCVWCRQPVRISL